MRKSLIIFVALAMVVAFAVPTMAAGLKVSGSYTDNYLEYKNGVINFEPGNLYLNFEFKEGDPVVALIKTRFDLTGASSNFSEINLNAQKFYIQTGSYVAYLGTPLTISVARAYAPAAYLLSDPGEPLGMARMDWFQTRVYRSDLDKLNFTDGDVIFKVTGKIQNVGITGMAVHDLASTPTPNDYRDRAVLRLTTDAVPGYKVGATYALKANVAANTVVNLGVDLSGGLPLAQGATMNLALGQSRTQTGDGWGDGQNAYWFGMSGYKIGGLTLRGDFRAVDPDFNAVFPKYDNSSDDSMVAVYKGQRQVFGALSADLNLAGQKGTLTVSNDYRVNFDGKKGVATYTNPYDNTTYTVKPRNTVSAEYSFSPAKDLSLAVGGSYEKCLSSQDNTDNNNYDDDAATTVYAKLNPYPIAPNVKVDGNVTWKREDRFMNPNEVAGAGTKLEGKVTVTPIANVTVEGNAKYSTGTYDFFADAPIASAQSRLDLSAFGKAEQTLSAPGVKSAKTVLAGAIGAHKVGTAAQKIYNVGYAEANLTITDKLTSRSAILVGNYEDPNYEPDNYIPYRQYVYTDLNYKVSSNSTATVAYTIREQAGGAPEKALFARYAVQLGGSILSLSYGSDASNTSDYGKLRTWDIIPSDPFNSGKPWEWLSRRLAGGTTTQRYKLSITIPF